MPVWPKEKTMLDKFLKMFGQRVEPTAPATKEKAVPKSKKTEKDLATERNEPYVQILKVDLDPENPRYGSFDLDWNSAFIARLSIAGYRGDKEEDLVDQWFQDVCRHVVLETYEQEQANIPRGDNVVRYINRKDRGDGKTEVS